MARKATSQTGPSALRLIEDAPIDLARAIVLVREGETEPAFALQDLADDDDELAPRQQIHDCLAPYDHEDLRPLEQRCIRIWRLAEGKGVTSLTTLADQKMSPDDHTINSGKPDALCRSIWALSRGPPDV